MTRKKTDNTLKNIFTTIGVLIILGFAVFLYLNGNFGSLDQINDAKKEMGIISESSDNDTKTNQSIDLNEEKFLDNQEKFDEKSQEQEIDKLINTQITYLTDNKFLAFDDFSDTDITNLSLEITGNTLTQVDKIIVNFSNKDSELPSSTYVLNKFNPGDESFLYRAFKKYDSMDYGKNEYLIEAFSGEQVSKIEVVIDVTKPAEKIINLETDKLPEGNEFGSPVSLGDGKVTYSDLKGLEIEKIEPNNFVCEKNPQTDKYRTTEILDEKISDYYWWNTCRPLSGSEGMTYFVLRLDGTGYVYEKHYVLPNGYYAVYELETGEEFVSPDDSSAVKELKLNNKSSELKKQNDTFQTVDIVDKLIKNLL